MKLSYEIVSGTHIGLVRKNNQDSYFIDEDQNLFIVADGLGGHLGGEVASSLSIQIMLDIIQKSSKHTNPQSLIKFLKKIYEQVNEEIYQQGQIHGSLRGMGTTLVSMLVQEDEVFIGNVGDSRAYLFRDNLLWQLTDDHNLRTATIKKHGFSSGSNTLENEMSGALTQSIGFTESVTPDIITKKVEPGDIYLLCSDGLYGMVPDQEILNLLKQESFNDISNRCIIKALVAGGFDNISVVAVRFKPS